MEGVRPSAEEIIRSSYAFVSGGEVSYWALNHVRREHTWLNQDIVSAAFGRMEQKGELTRISEGRFQRASMAKRWIVMPWRKRSNEQLGIGPTLGKDALGSSSPKRGNVTIYHLCPGEGGRRGFSTKPIPPKKKAR